VGKAESESNQESEDPVEYTLDTGRRAKFRQRRTHIQEYVGTTARGCAIEQSSTVFATINVIAPSLAASKAQQQHPFKTKKKGSNATGQATETSVRRSWTESERPTCTPY
jgi:hypothetical protein